MFKVTLEITRERSGKCTLPANHSLIEPPDKAVTVQGPVTGASKNTWTITANKKGLHVVLIFDNDAGETPGEIHVRVPNTPPKWIRSNPALGPLFLNGYPGDPGTKSVTTSLLSPGGYFDDVDEDDKTTSGAENVGVFKYKIAYKPDELLIDTKDGFVDVVMKQLAEVASAPMRANIPIIVKASY